MKRKYFRICLSEEALDYLRSQERLIWNEAITNLSDVSLLDLKLSSIFPYGLWIFDLVKELKKRTR